jgi:ribonuclease HIII
MQKLAQNKIESLISSLREYNFNCTPIDKKQYNFETTVIKNNEKIKLLVYFGKKGVKTILQGNTNSATYNETESIVTGNFSLKFKKEEDQQYKEYIGTDETGKGDFFGPLVVAGMYVNEEVQNYLLNLNVRDSKELNDFQIDQIAAKIRKAYPNNYSVISINPQKYNKLYEDFKNVNKLLDWAHSKVIENIFKKFETDTVIIDQFSKTPISISFKNQFLKVNFVQLPKAEKYLGVAAASILARNQMNIWFNKKRKEGFNVLKGASQEVENEAKKILNNGNKEKMNELIKLHFKTTKKIFEDYSEIEQ